MSEQKPRNNSKYFDFSRPSKTFVEPQSDEKKSDVNILGNQTNMAQRTSRKLGPETKQGHGDYLASQQTERRDTESANP